jgi:hypothetical protein
MKMPCGCCEGTRELTPLPTANRPGLSALAYRVGTHPTFLETMKAVLSGIYIDIPLSELDQAGNQKIARIYPLQGLKTRENGDPAIALLDAWATVGDVLTFYQERIINEGYLRTAVERLSILELSRLVRYRLRPGVASSVYLAYTLEKDYSVEIPAGARAQSLPGPGELPQSFETSEALEARFDWNNLQPRMTRPQRITLDNAETVDTLYFQGTTTNLKTNDPLLLVFGSDAGLQFLRFIKTVEQQFAEDRTRVTLQVSRFGDAVKQIMDQYVKNLEAFCISDQDPLAVETIGILNPDSERFNQMMQDLQDKHDKAASAGNSAVAAWIGSLISEFEELADSSNAELLSTTVENKQSQAFAKLSELISPLSKKPSLQPATPQGLLRDIKETLSVKRDAAPQLLTVFQPEIASAIYPAWKNAVVTPEPKVRVYALRQTASLFGSNAPRKVTINRDTGEILKTAEWPVVEIDHKTLLHEEESTIYLDSSYEKILSGSWIVVDTSAVKELGLITNFKLTSAPLLICKTGKVRASISRAEYGIVGKTTQIDLPDPWIKYNDHLKKSEDADFQIIRRTKVYAQSELLTLADETIREDICGKEIELNDLYDGLQSGRWVIVSGERTDIPNTSRIKASELVMLAGVNQSFDETLPNDKVHSTLITANDLAYRYKRDTAVIYGNVVKATHGETRSEVLGSGDGSKMLQQFTLRQPPLTYVSAPTPDGIVSTLVVRVNDVQWNEADSLAGFGPKDRNFITSTDDDDKTTVIFGNGKQGTRLPTGVENIKAVYRNGIGKSGNVKAEQISLLTTKPLGVKGVINPLAASGGANKDNRDQARRNAPLPTMALDRLVSVQDYADFARTFAGIGKACSARLSDGRQEMVHVTIAGADDIPIESNSDLFLNLRLAMHQFGDPFEPIKLAVRELLLLVISANVRVLPGYKWELVEPGIRSALLDTFGFDRRALGQSAFVSEVISTIQQVAGVAYVDLDSFGSIAENFTKDDLDKLVNAKQPKDVAVQFARFDPFATDPDKRIQSAQLAYLTPSVPATLNLNGS